MTNQSYEELIENDESFGRAVRHWEELADDIAASLGQAGEWERWRNRCYANGVPFHEEYQWNPIFDRRSPRLDRGFSIIQHRGADQDVARSRGGWVDAWVNDYRDFEGDLPSDVVTLSLETTSDVDTRTARRLIQKWMTPETTIDEMREVIELSNRRRGTNG